MAKKSRRRLLVPDAEQGLNAFKTDLMRREGYAVNPSSTDDVKYEVAKELGIPLKPNDNGNLTTESVGKVGGKIGGLMVRELILLAKEQLVKRTRL
ncbi:MAG: alpha/beta hydrolase [Bacilli bacterium]|nr:alpha/beta hydrolase [Bacilli bacterium]